VASGLKHVDWGDQQTRHPISALILYENEINVYEDVSLKLSRNVFVFRLTVLVALTVATHGAAFQRLDAKCLTRQCLQAGTCTCCRVVCLGFSCDAGIVPEIGHGFIPDVSSEEHIYSLFWRSEPGFPLRSPGFKFRSCVRAKCIASVSSFHLFPDHAAQYHILGL
jgi:hypothetical protein